MATKTTPNNKSAGKPAKKKTLVLLDSHAIIHRAYHALPDFSTSKGVPTGALYGLTSMLLAIIDKFKPDYIVACYDLPGPTYRHEAYDAYKGGRKKTDEALVTQLVSSRELVEIFNIPIYDKPGFEADDMLGTIVEEVLHPKNKNAGKKEAGEFADLNILIASGDMDTLQLVEGKRVKVFTLKKGIKDTVIYDEEAVKERFGFDPLMLPDYKGLRGDPSDNIIGIAGIGEKTATILLTKFGTIEDIYKALKKPKGPEAFKAAGLTDRVIELLKNGEEEALFSKMLATIRRDAPIDFKLPEVPWKEGVNVDKVEELFKRLEFRTLLARVKQMMNVQTSFLAEGSAGGGEEDFMKNAPNIDDMGEGGANEGGDTKGGGTKKAGIDVAKIPSQVVRKLSLQLWVIDSNMTNPSIEDVLSHSAAYKNSKDDASVTVEDIGKAFDEEIKKQGLERTYKEIELPLFPVLDKMEKVGIKLDLPYVKKLAKEYHDDLDKLEKNIWKSAGKEFNIASPKQLSEILFDTLGLGGSKIKKTAGGARSTKESELEKMKDTHPIINMILEYRELSKLLGTYVDPLPMLVDSDGRLHANFLQAGSTTGRMASQNPNLQNIPIKTEQGRKVRQAFVAEKGYKLVSLDYSQIELRIAAFLSGDENMIEIFKKGTDIHTGAASRVFKVPEADVTKEMRRRAKTINFGVMYGMGVNALRGNLGSTREEAQTFYNEYFKAFSGLADYLERIKQETKKKGYTETFFGRRRYFEGMSSPLPFIRASAERMAINAPVQGTGADMVKLAMKKIDDVVEKDFKDKDGNDTARLLLQVHDELVYEVKDDKGSDTVERFIKAAKDAMEHVLPLKETSGVPIVADAHVGDNWNQMETV